MLQRQIVDLFNEQCKPAVFTTVDECLKYTINMKLFCMNPDLLNAQTILRNQSISLSIEGMAPENQLMYHLVGSTKQNVTDADVEGLRTFFSQLRQTYNCQENILGAIKEKNSLMTEAQKLLVSLTQDGVINAQNMADACDLITQLRRRCGNNASVPLMDLLIKGKDQFHSDWQKMLPIIKQTFQRVDGDTSKLGSAGQIAATMLQGAEAFRNFYDMPFAIAIQKALGEVQEYKESLEHEFLLSDEIKVLAEMIWAVFQIETKHPLDFLQYFQGTLLKTAQEKHKQEIALDSCITSLLNTQMIPTISDIFVNITGRALVFQSVEDFFKETAKALQRFNSTQDFSIGELAQFAVHEMRTKQNEEGSERLSVTVLYNTSAFLSKVQNKTICDLIRFFEHERYFEIHEQRSELDNSQPIFQLTAIVGNLSRILESLGYTQKGLLLQLAAFATAMESTACGWFAQVKRPSVSALKREVKNFDARFVCQNTQPLHYCLKLFLAENGIVCPLLAAPSTQATEQYTVSAFDKFIQEEFELAQPASLLQFYTAVVKENQQRSKAGLLEVLEQCHARYQTTQQFQVVEDIFGDVELDVAAAVVRHGKELSREFAGALGQFYFKASEFKNTFCFTEPVATAFKQLAKLCGFDVKVCQAIDVLLSIASQKETLNENFKELLGAKSVPILKILALMKELCEDRVMKAVVDKESWNVLLMKMFLSDEMIAGIQAKKLSKADTIKESLALACQNAKVAKTSDLLEVIDPADALQRGTFLEQLEEYLVKPGVKVEKALKVNSAKLAKFYVLNKKAYGKKFASFADLFSLLKTTQQPIIVPEISQHTEPGDVEAVPEEVEAQVATERQAAPPVPEPAQEDAPPAVEEPAKNPEPQEEQKVPESVLPEEKQPEAQPEAAAEEVPPQEEK